MGPLIFLIKLAWDCRYRLPLLITVGFMALDIRMQLDVNVHTRRIHRPRPIYDTPDSNDDNGSDDSWQTLPDDSETESEGAVAATSTE